MSFKITKLGIELYKYYASGQERYTNGTFSGFNSTTNQNKKEKYVNISIDPKDKNLISATTEYSSNIVCSVEKENIFGTQFHPEKSDKIGLNIIHNFINI